MSDMRLHTTDPKALSEFKTAVKAHLSWQEVSDWIEKNRGLEYTPSHISSVLSGHSRPSYMLADALLALANDNMKKLKTKKWSQTFKEKGITIKCKKYDLRDLPFAKYEGNTHEYFAPTPSRTIVNYDTGLPGKTMGYVSDKLGVTERTLQKYVTRFMDSDSPSARQCPAEWKTDKIKIGSFSGSKLELVQSIAAHSLAAE